MAAETTLGELIQCAWEVGALLNSIPDDDAREAAQEKFEQILNDELWKGSQNRQLAKTLDVLGGSLPPVRELAARVDRGNALIAATVGLRLIKSDEQRLVDALHVADQHDIQRNLKW